MGHNSMVSGYPKSIGIPRVDELSMRPSGFGASQARLKKSSFEKTFSKWIEVLFEY